LVKKDARFCVKVGQLAVQRILEGCELTGIDVLDALNQYMAAACAQAREAPAWGITTEQVTWIRRSPTRR